MKQKLVSIEKSGSQSRTVEEELEIELRFGWRIRQIVPLQNDAHDRNPTVGGWLYVLLERE